MFEYQLNMAETVGFAIILLLLGRWIKKKVGFINKFLISLLKVKVKLSV